MELAATHSVGLNVTAGSGGFLNPENVVSQFGISEGMIIADFGSGAGHLMIEMAKKVGLDGKVYAVDIMEDKLDSVRIKAKAVGLENVETIKTNLEVLGSSGLADNSQDAVVLANILFQSNKKEDILKEAKRVLKSNGIIVVIDWKKGTKGFGPPDNLRTDDVAMQSLVMSQGFKFSKQIDAGQFHYGLAFRK